MIQITLPFSQWNTFKDDILQAASRQAVGGYNQVINGVQYVVRTNEPYGYKIHNDAIIQVCDDDLITKDQVFSIVTAGGDVKDYFLAVEMTDAKFNGNVPNTIPNYQTTDDEGVTTPVTWSQWVGNNTVVTNTNNKKMFQLWGCTASQAKSLVGVTGYTVLSKTEYQALVPVQE